MNDFYQAFYTCDGGAFMVAYDSDTPASATLTTNNNRKAYDLKRLPGDAGLRFSGGAAKFSVEGKAATLEGTPTPLKNCKLKSG